MDNSDDMLVSHDLGTGSPILAMMNFLGILIIKGDHNIYSNCNHKRVFMK